MVRLSRLLCFILTHSFKSFFSYFYVQLDNSVFQKKDLALFLGVSVTTSTLFIDADFGITFFGIHAFSVKLVTLDLDRQRHLQEDGGSRTVPNHVLILRSERIV